MKTTEQIKKEIMEKVTSLDHVSFAEFKGEDYEGDSHVAFADHPSLIFWNGMSESFKDAVAELSQNKQIMFQTTKDLLTYTIDGRLLTLPVAKQIKDYKLPRWLPVVMRPYAEDTPLKAA